MQAAAASTVALPTVASFRQSSGRTVKLKKRSAAGHNRNALIRASSEADAAAPPAAAAAFADLAAVCLERTVVTLEPCGPQGNGLVVTKPVAAGQVVLQVPLGACLAVNYAAGLALPPGHWPRLRKGVAKDDSLPWDMLLVRMAYADSALVMAVPDKAGWGGGGSGGSNWRALLPWSPPGVMPCFHPPTHPS